MMKTSIYYKMAVVLAGMMTSCGSEDIPTYNSEANAVRFSSDIADGYSGGVLYQSYSFASSPLDESMTVEIPLELVGKTADHDRAVSISVDQESSTAETGSYEILESYIPADTIAGNIKLKLYNVTGDSTYVLRLKINESAELKLGPSEYLTASVSWNNSLPAPNTTYTRRTYNMLIKGTSSFSSTSTAYYSPNALKTIVTALGWDDWDDPAAHPEYPAAFKRYFTRSNYKYLPHYSLLYVENSHISFAAQLGEYIEQYNSTHDTPLLHDAGQLEGQPIEARKY